MWASRGQRLDCQVLGQCCLLGSPGKHLLWECCVVCSVVVHPGVLWAASGQKILLGKCVPYEGSPSHGHSWAPALPARLSESREMNSSLFPCQSIPLHPLGSVTWSPAWRVLWGLAGLGSWAGTQWLLERAHHSSPLQLNPQDTGGRSGVSSFSNCQLISCYL